LYNIILDAELQRPGDALSWSGFAWQRVSGGVSSAPPTAGAHAPRPAHAIMMARAAMPSSFAN